MTLEPAGTEVGGHRMEAGAARPAAAQGSLMLDFFEGV
jgi:hypothetical protein